MTDEETTLFRLWWPALLLLMPLITLMLSLTSCGVLPTAQKAETAFENVQGNVTQQIEQVSGLDPQTLGKLAICAVGWIIGLGLFSYLLPNPTSREAKLILVGLVFFLFIGLPILMFG